jgi:hypothetical protein
MIAICIECGEPFEAKRKDASLCSSRCRKRRARASRIGRAGVQARSMALVPQKRDIERREGRIIRVGLDRDEGTIKYGRDPDEKAYQGRKLLHDFLLVKKANDEIPTNNRFVDYEWKQKGWVIDTPTGRTDGFPPFGTTDLNDYLTWLREQDIVPWSWIEDESRSIACWDYSDSVIEGLREDVEYQRLNPWGNDKLPPLVACESAATAGVLKKAVQPYRCPIMGTSGQTAGFLHTQVVPLMTPWRDVIYVGDLNRVGLDIEANTRRIIGGDWHRLGITEEQAEEAEIEGVWKIDGRDKVGGWSWEAESLGQSRLTKILTDKLDSMLPEPLKAVQAREKEQQEAATAFLTTYPGRSTPLLLTSGRLEDLFPSPAHRKWS